jgi:predicted acetyltransferase
MAVTVTQAFREQAPILLNLMQFYMHDFSAFFVGTDRRDVEPDGRYADYALDDYWTQPNWSAFLIHCDGALAGFALINDQAHSGQAIDRSVAEFCVLRKYRGQGVGRIAAEALFSRHPGSWEVAVMRKNLAAAAFWRGTIQHAALARDVVELDLHDDGWNGPVLRFGWG